jgi:ADP-ribose pyrophosphatase YjhB (NUDIX family)
MDNFHIIQMQILRELAFKPNSNFSRLNISGLTNDHFSYHVRTLLKIGYIKKSEKGYILSNKGKTYVSHMDTDKSQIEKLPKVSVLIVITKKIRNTIYYAISTRTKEPYFGYSGFITGKVRFGETIHEAAARELDEEMNLTAKFKNCFILHEMVYDTKGNQLEDKFFHIVAAYDTKGEIAEKTQEGKNSWVTERQLEKLEPKFHNEMEIFYWVKNKSRGFKEEKYVIEKF